MDVCGRGGVHGALAVGIPRTRTPQRGAPCGRASTSEVAKDAGADPVCAKGQGHGGAGSAQVSKGCVSTCVEEAKPRVGARRLWDARRGTLSASRIRCR